MAFSKTLPYLTDTRDEGPKYTPAEMERLFRSIDKIKVDEEKTEGRKSDTSYKLTNPKDGIGSRKWRQLATIPVRVLWEVGVAMLEGALKYGRFNYRVSGVRASVYYDAAVGHITQWAEGEDLDPDTGLSHITKAIASLMVLRDGMLEGNFIDDRQPKHHKLDAHRDELQKIVDEMLAKYPEPCRPFTEIEDGAEAISAMDH